MRKRNFSFLVLLTTSLSISAGTWSQPGQYVSAAGNAEQKVLTSSGSSKSASQEKWTAASLDLTTVTSSANTTATLKQVPTTYNLPDGAQPDAATVKYDAINVLDLNDYTFTASTANVTLTGVSTPNTGTAESEIWKFVGADDVKLSATNLGDECITEFNNQYVTAGNGNPSLSAYQYYYTNSDGDEVGPRYIEGYWADGCNSAPLKGCYYKFDVNAPGKLVIGFCLNSNLTNNPLYIIDAATYTRIPSSTVTIQGFRKQYSYETNQGGTTKLTQFTLNDNGLIVIPDGLGSATNLNLYGYITLNLEAASSFYLLSPQSQMGIYGFEFTSNNATTSGECGDGVTWSKTGTELTISFGGTGTGKMTDYDPSANPAIVAPWNEPDPDLTNVTIGDGVTSIGKGAFALCQNLTTITIPSSVTSIGNGAFYECTGLETVTIEAEALTTYGADAFSGCHNDLIIYVPAASLDTYKQNWSAYADKIQAYVPPTYTAEIALGTDDADNWTIEPAEAKTTGVTAGTALTVTYSGTREVKSVKAVEKVVNLSKVTAYLELKDGDIITGTLNANVKITIADGATVTLRGVTINGTNNQAYRFAGLNCAGDATIILADGSENAVKGFYDEYPGIFVLQNKTLTIKGDGQLSASSNGWGCGIGGGFNLSCGNIDIQGGIIEATGGGYSAGIGSGHSASCGAISISGGTVKAQGGSSAAGIGKGGGTGSCTSVTISGEDTKVTATMGSGAENSIAATTVTIGGTVTGNISASPYTYPAPSYTMAAAATAHDKGKLICTDGHIHAYGEDAACTKNRVAKIIYVGTTGDDTYTHGLALALTDEGQMNWATAGTTCSGKNTSTPVTAATWFLASKAQWDYMLGTKGAGSASDLRDGFESVGGTNMQSGSYQTSTKYSDYSVYIYDFSNSEWSYGYSDPVSIYNVRACLAF